MTASTLCSPTDRPIHLAGVFDGGELRLFIDGRLTGVSTVSYTLEETAGGLVPGGVAPGHLAEERGFRGRIHAVRISDGVRYQTDFDPPRRLENDTRTLARFPFFKGPQETTRSRDANAWPAEIIDCQWNLQSIDSP